MPADTFTLVIDVNELVGGAASSKGTLTIRYQGTAQYAIFDGDDLRALDAFSGRGNGHVPPSVSSGYTVPLPTDVAAGGDHEASLVGYDVTWRSDHATVRAAFKARPAGSTWKISQLTNPEAIPVAESAANADRAEAAADSAATDADRAETAADAAEEAVGLTGEDDAVALLGATHTSDTQAAFRKVFGGQLCATDPRFAGGAKFDGTTDDSDALDAWLDAMIAAGTSGLTAGVEGVLPAGIGRVTRSLARRDTGVSLTIRGAGAGQTFLYGDFTGAGEGILDLSDADAPNRYGRHRISGIGFLGNGVPGDPIGLLCLNAIENVVDDIDAPQGITIPGATNRASGNPALMNSVVVVTNDNNSKWTNVRSQSGCQPKAFDLGGTTASFTSGGTTITASASVFTAAMVGKPIYFASGAANHDIWRATITAQSGTTATIDTAAPSTGTGVRFAVGHITGSVSAGSTSLTLGNVVGLSSAYVGMQVHVIGAATKTDAGNTAGLLSTRVAAVSGNTITLERPATATVTDAIVLFAPAVFLGTFEGDPSAPQTNHSWWTNLHCEGYAAAGLIANKVYYTIINNLKLHGAAYSYAGDWSENYMPAVLSEIKSLNIKHVQAAYGVIYPSGFHISGSRGTLMMDDIQTSHLYKDRQPFHVATATDEFRLLLGDVWLANSLSGFPAGYAVASAPKKYNVSATGQVSSREKHNTMSKTPGMVAAGMAAQHGTITMTKDTVHTYRPPGTQGILVLMCSSADTSALITYRTSDHVSGGLSGMLATPSGGFVDVTPSAGALSGTTGTDGRVTMRVDTAGNIQIENRRSTLLRVSLVHLAFGV